MVARTIGEFLGAFVNLETSQRSEDGCDMRKFRSFRSLTTVHATNDGRQF